MDQTIFLRELKLCKNLVLVALLFSGIYFQLIMPVISIQPEWEGLLLLISMMITGSILALFQGNRSREHSDGYLQVLPLSTSILVLSRALPRMGGSPDALGSNLCRCNATRRWRYLAGGTFAHG